MKHKPRVYAKALVDALAKKGASQQEIAKNFLALLKKNQDVKKAKEILALAESLLLQRTGNKKIILETARKLDNKDLVKSIAKKGDIVEEKINPALIAGMKIIVNDRQQADHSLRAKLNNLF